MSGSSCSRTRCCTPRCGTATASAARDPYLWNVACDYVINGWLVEMGVGEMPDGTALRPDAGRAVGRGGLRPDRHRPAPAAEARHAARPRARRHARRAAPVDRLARRSGVDLDEFYRRALLTGHAYHDDGGRGLLPAGLVEEIRALEHPPLPWDARLARWFDEFVPSPTARPVVRAAVAPPGRPRRTSPGPAGATRTRWSSAARSASCWTPPARWSHACSARRSARSRPTPPPATCRRRGWCSATRPPTTSGSCAVGRHRRPGPRPRARRHRPAARHRPAGARGRLPAGRADPGHHRRRVRRRPGPARARVSDPGRRTAAVHSARPGLPRSMISRRVP